MMPKRRLRRSRHGWPDNLYPNPVGGRTYYRYRHPQKGTWHGLGPDYAEAKEVARILNARLMGSTSSVEAAASEVLGGKIAFSKLVEEYEAHLKASRNKRGLPLAKQSLQQYHANLSRAERSIGAGKAVDAVTRRDVDKLLQTIPDSMHNGVRGLMVRLFDFAASKGYRDGCTPENPAASALTKTVRVQRNRLALEWYRAIHAAAPAWYQVAMDLALQTLQRREDLTRIRYDDEREPGKLFVEQIKLRGQESGNICIEIGPALREVIERSRDEIACPFVIHARPYRIMPKSRNYKQHWAQVTNDKMTGMFAELRDVVPEIKKMGPRAKPTFHEIRSLGADLYRKTGRPETEIQALLGHTKLATTMLYLDRRGSETRYTMASAGLQIP